MTQHLLLTGAGFSHNWGGWLASEVFEYLLGTCEVQASDRLRGLLWKHRSSGGFEGTLAELQSNARQSKSPEDMALLGDMQRAVVDMFRAMDSALGQHPWNFTDEVRKQVGPFLGQFDAIYTLNQDTLLERHYVQNIHVYGQRRGFHSVVLPGMRRVVSQDPFDANSWAASTWYPEGESIVRLSEQPLYKLHGSVNWRVSQGDPILIIGGGKSDGIAQVPVLAGYLRDFRERLLAGARLMVIGYGFGDEHINQILNEASTHGMKLFVIDPRGSGLAASLNPLRVPAAVGASNTPMEELFMKCLIGVSRRPLSTTFGGDVGEHAKVLRFFE